jgi:hypothetical protein
MISSQAKELLRERFPDGKKVIPMQVPPWYATAEKKEENHQKVVEILRAYA